MRPHAPAETVSIDRGQFLVGTGVDGAPPQSIRMTHLKRLAAASSYGTR